MPISPDLLKALSDLGGTTLFVGVVIVAAIGLYRQWWVPGWLYRSEREGRQRAEREARASATTVSRLTMALTRERQRRHTDRPPRD